jgi:hypothetical protein
MQTRQWMWALFILTIILLCLTFLGYKQFKHTLDIKMVNYNLIVKQNKIFNNALFLAQSDAYVSPYSINDISSKNLYSFEELNMFFRSSFDQSNVSIYKDEYVDIVTQNSLAGFNLLEKYKSTGNIDLFFGANNQVGYYICVRLLIKENLIKAISSYGREDQENFINDYVALQKAYNGVFYEKGIGNQEEYFVAWNTGESFIMMGYYNQYIYYVALVDKSIVKL